MAGGLEVMRARLQSVIQGERYQSAGKPWDATYVYSDAVSLYQSLTDPIERADFERVIVELLSSEVGYIRNFAIEMCYQLQIRAAIPWLLRFMQDTPERSYAGYTAAFALAAMGVKEASVFFESRGQVALLFKVDYQRALPAIQQLIEKTCETGYDEQKARQIPQPPLHELSRIFDDLYSRFGVNGILLLLSEIKITSQPQQDFLLDAIGDAVQAVSSERVVIEMHEPLSPEVQRSLELEYQRVLEKVSNWLDERKP